MSLTEEYFGKSGVHLLNTIVNEAAENPNRDRAEFSEHAKYILSHNSAKDINDAMDLLTNYLIENNVTYENIIDPNFLTSNEIDGMSGGMRITNVLLAVIVTAKVVSGWTFTEAGHEVYRFNQPLIDTAIAGIKGITFSVGKVGYHATAATFGVLDEVGEFAGKTVKAWTPPTSSQVAQINADATARIAAARREARDARIAAREQAARAAAAEQEAAMYKTAFGVTLGSIAVAVLGKIGLNVNWSDCKTKGNLPPVNFNKIATSDVVKYNFDQAIGRGEHRFHTLKEACIAASEGYPLYGLNGPIWNKINTWEELNHYFDQQMVVATKNHEMPRRGGTKRRKKRRSTRRR